jgi:hypothetical protein
MVPVAPIVTGITCVFTFHMSSISLARFLYFRFFSASFLIIFLCHEFATSINIHVSLLLFLMFLVVVLLLLLLLLVLLFQYGEFLNNVGSILHVG